MRDTKGAASQSNTYNKEQDICEGSAVMYLNFGKPKIGMVKALTRKRNAIMATIEENETKMSVEMPLSQCNKLEFTAVTNEDVPLGSRIEFEPGYGLPVCSGVIKWFGRLQEGGHRQREIAALQADIILPKNILGLSSSSELYGAFMEKHPHLKETLLVLYENPPCAVGVKLSKGANGALLDQSPSPSSSASDRLPSSSKSSNASAVKCDSERKNSVVAAKSSHSPPLKKKKLFVQEDVVYDHPPGHPIQKEDMVVYKERAAGVVKLIFRDKTSQTSMVALELEEVSHECTAGIYKGLPLVQTASKNILFCQLNQCKPDPRFAENINLNTTDRNIPHAHRRERETQYPSKNLEGACGLWKGIQGDINSCYMDSTLFSMFAFSDSFDFLLEAGPEAKKLREILRENVVYPLRKYGHVAADSMHLVREELGRIGKVKGIGDREKDPEEFINLLLNDAFKCAPLIELSNNQTCNTLDLVADKDEATLFPSVQQLLERLCEQVNIKLKKTPSCLILHMPRFGKHYKLYDRIFPDLSIDLMRVTEHSQRLCFICSTEEATYECPNCCDEQKDQRKALFCATCHENIHKHADRKGHYSRGLSPSGQRDQRDHTLELSAVLCIETSHYVSFCKTAAGQDAPWVFFDSMAQREDGVNIPEVTLVPEAPRWLSRQGYDDMCKGVQPPRPLSRLFKDVYICIYCATSSEDKSAIESYCC